MVPSAMTSASVSDESPAGRLTRLRHGLRDPALIEPAIIVLGALAASVVVFSIQNALQRAAPLILTGLAISMLIKGLQLLSS